MWRFHAIDTVSQTRLGSLDGILASWQLTLNGAASADLDIYPDSGGLNPASKDSVRRFTEPVKRSILICWDDTPWLCGPIWTREWDETGANPSLKLSVSGPESLWDKRKVLEYGADNAKLRNWLNVLNPTATPDSVHAAMPSIAVGGSGVSMTELLLMAMRAALDPTLDGNSPDGSIIYPYVQPGRDAVGDYTALPSDLADLGSAISSIQGQMDAPDMTVTPVWADANHTGVSYRIDAGDRLNSQYLALNATYGLPDGPVLSFDDSEDGTTVVNQQWAKGSGQDTDMLIAAAYDRHDPNMPLIAGETDYTSVSDPATLSALVQGDLAAHLTPTRTLGLVVDGSAPQTMFGGIPLGCMAAITFNHHPWEPDGTQLGRIVSMSGTGPTGGPLCRLGLDMEE